MKMNAVNNRKIRYARPRRRRYAYPNAAEGSYFLDKLLDGALAAATSLGTVTILFCLFTMG